MGKRTAATPWHPTTTKPVIRAACAIGGALGRQSVLNKCVPAILESDRPAVLLGKVLHLSGIAGVLWILAAISSADQVEAIVEQDVKTAVHNGGRNHPC